jgi:hypothetical protein
VGDPCEEATCTAGRCGTRPLGGAAGADCQLGQLGTGPCPGETLDSKLARFLDTKGDKVTAALDKAAEAGTPARQVTRLARQARKTLKAMRKKADAAAKRRKNPISEQCRTSIGAAIQSVDDFIGASLL